MEMSWKWGDTVSRNDLGLKEKYISLRLGSLTSSQIDQMIDIVDGVNDNIPVQIRPMAARCDAYAKLISMVGCDAAKQTIKAMIAQSRMNTIIHLRKRSVFPAYYHAVFTGNPGCAKTTCARLYAEILHEEGITRSSRFAELNRASLVGAYVGHTEKNVRDAFEENAGGTIFIDEAYALCEDADNDSAYGTQAINEIIVELENHPDTVVIFAGYPDKMEKFLNANPGLRSRIPYRVSFEDYTEGELVSISQVMAKERGFEISEQACKELKDFFAVERQSENFGNGRTCRNMVEEAIRSRSINLGVLECKDLNLFADTARYTDEDLFTLTETDFVFHNKQPSRAQARIGFS